MEIITNSYGRKSWNECGSEKKALCVIGSLGSPGKLIHRLWLIELQTCQSDNMNSLWLVHWNVQLSSLAPGQFLPVKGFFLNWKTRSSCLHPVFYLWWKLDRRQVHSLSSHNWQCWKQDIRIKTWLWGKYVFNRWFLLHWWIYLSSHEIWPSLKSFFFFFFFF